MKYFGKVAAYKGIGEYFGDKPLTSAAVSTLATGAMAYGAYRWGKNRGKKRPTVGNTFVNPAIAGVVGGPWALGGYAVGHFAGRKQHYRNRHTAGRKAK